MRFRSIAAMVVLVLAGGAASVSTPGPVMARTVPCPDQPLTVGDLRRLWSDGGDFAGFMGATNPRFHECFGRSEVRIRGFVNRPDGLGGVRPTVMKPTWLAERSALILFGSSREIAPGYGAGGFYAISVPPSFGRLEKRYQRSWVDVTAHVDDPAARTCHNVGPKDVRLSKRESVALCRDVLVLSSIRQAGGPLTDAATAPVPVNVTQPGPPRPAWPVLLPAAFFGAWLWLRRIRGGAHHRR